MSNRKTRIQYVLYLMILGTATAGLRAQTTTDRAVPSTEDRRWLNRDVTDEERARALLREMSLEEKIGQLWQMNGIGGTPTGDADGLVADSELYGLIRDGQLGSILNEIHVATINALQRVAVEESRLGVPLIFGRDVIHGFRTIFPIPLGQAASWNPTLVEAAAAVAAKEARWHGVHWTFAPMVDIARDPRWGRIAESPGEDPQLAAAMAAAMVRGFQGMDLSAPDRVAACAKHLVGYGAAEGGRDYNTTEISPALLHNIYLPSFRAAVHEGVATLMTGFNELNGIPCSANNFLLRDVVRGQWKFDGLVISDWTSIREMIEHGYVADLKSAALAAASAGVNMEMVSQSYHKHLVTLVHEGRIPENEIDSLAMGVLRLKFRLGLFEHPFVNESAPSPLLSKDHLQLARKLACQSVVLLKNADHLLPLDRDKLKTLAVIGPLADAPRDQLGTWIPDGQEADSRTPLSAIRESSQGKINVVYASGLKSDLDRDASAIPDAVDAARRADVVLLFVGEGANLSGEARSRAILDLPGAQNQLVAAVAEAGTPVVMVVMAGRPLTIGHQIDQADAVLYAWHAGTMAGPGIADLLWGNESPSGKLPVTFPKSVGQIPLYYNHKNTGRPPRKYDFTKNSAVDDQINTELGFNSNYIDVEPYPLFPFGYGLSYATFEYGKPELSTNRVRSGQTLAVRVPVKNTGTVVATEIVQLYVRDLVASITRPVRELKAFRRVPLKPGETIVVEFALPADDLGFIDDDIQLQLEPGVFEIFVGGSSIAPSAGRIEVVARIRAHSRRTGRLPSTAYSRP
jgi:beta-glucosidase